MIVRRTGLEGLPSYSYLLQINSSAPINPNPNNQPNGQGQSMANLPTAQDIENNNQHHHHQHRVTSNSFIVSPQGNYMPTNYQVEQINNTIKNNLEYYRNNRRVVTVSHDRFLVSHNNEREPYFDPTANKGLKLLYDNYGYYLNPLSFASVVQQGKLYLDKMATDRITQQIFSVIQAICLIPSICYFSLARDLFQKDIASDIYTLLIVSFNLLIILCRYLISLKLKTIMSEIEAEEFDSPQVLLFLIHIRDTLGNKTTGSLTRNDIQNSITKGFNSTIVWALNILSAFQYILILFSIYFCVNEEFKTKIYNQSNIAAFIVMTYISLGLFFYYLVTYSVVFGILGLILGSFALLCFSVYLIYQLFQFILHFLNYIGTKICGCTEYFKSRSNQVAPHWEEVTVQLNAETYVKRNTKTIIYQASKCKDGLCSICLEEFTEGQTQIKQMICCKSGFHITCIANWALEKKTCPNCRSEDIFQKKQSRRIAQLDQLGGILRNVGQALNEMSPFHNQQQQQRQQQQQSSQEESAQGSSQSQSQPQPQPQQQTQAQLSNGSIISQENQQEGQNSDQNNQLNQEINSAITQQVQQQQSINLNSQQMQIDNQEQPPRNQQMQQESQQQGSNIELDDNHMLHGHHKHNLNYEGIFERNNRASIGDEPQNIAEQINQDLNKSFESYDSADNHHHSQQQKQKKQFHQEMQQQNSINFIHSSIEEIGSNTQFYQAQNQQHCPPNTKLVSLNYLEKQIEEKPEEDSQHDISQENNNQQIQL